MKHNINNIPSFIKLKQRVVWLANEIKNLGSQTADQITTISNILSNSSASIYKHVSTITTMMGGIPPVLTYTETNIFSNFNPIPIIRRRDIGEYYISAGGQQINSFPLGKTVVTVILNDCIAGALVYEIDHSNDSMIDLYFYDNAGDPTDNILNLLITVEVYP